ncbi:hypothetical protein KC963_02470 [Candidatus Saccharibacteria bacterium]|nr:hypothetical protein [Candidatus Saccharibacteria bacterium]
MSKRSHFHDQLLTCSLFTEIRHEGLWITQDLRDSILELGEEIPATQVVSRALRRFRRDELLSAHPASGQNGLCYEYELTEQGIHTAVSATGAEIAKGHYYALEVVAALATSSLYDHLKERVNTDE